MNFRVLVVFMVFAYSFCHGQEYRRVKVMVGAGYASAGGLTSGGIFGTFEPAYRINDQVQTGLRMELAGVARGGIEGVSFDVQVSRISSYTINAIYYFEREIVSIFAGAGFGRYSFSAIEYNVSGSGPSQAAGRDSKFGFYPRLGADLGHLTFSIDYNIIPRTKGINGAEFRNSYLGIRLGVFFGGGRKIPSS